MSPLRRSSNSPRYFAPATIEASDKEMTFLSCSMYGTEPSTMRCASPSAMAVLPTPGSPKRIGLFFVRRARIWMTRWISLSRPMTGSMRSSLAMSLRLRPYFLRSCGAWRPLPFSARPGSGPSPSGCGWSMRSSTSFCRASISTPILASNSAAAPSVSSKSESRMCSVPM